MDYSVLIIDDSEIIRKSLKNTFRSARIKIKKIAEAENGAVALSILEEQADFDVIFLDINMPVMNGIEFMEAFHKNEAWNTTPVILVSTEGSAERHQQLTELGVKAILRKPVRPEQLASTLKNVLGNSQ